VDGAHGREGWTAPTWPTEYGGGGLSAAQAKVLEQELAAAKLPPPLMGFGLEMIGPTLLNFGTEEQKREHLTKIARGEIRWCQGYSEPDSGSDLASLQTRAVREATTSS
jgi:alkylation response protein AidB-like acyl-CoA dehydrogenase